MANPRRGADAVMQALKAAGIDTVFTLSGNHIMPLFDAAIEAGTQLIHTRHEAAAVHMAEAAGRLTGRPGVAMVTGGPGHANACAALFTALGADAPLVLLSGHAPTRQLGKGAFQELAQADMAGTVTKASWMTGRVEDLEADITRALELAASGRPGPVHLSLPSDLLEATLPPADAGGDDAVPRTAPAPMARMAVGLPETALAAIRTAKRPVIVAGPPFARQDLRAALFATADAIGIPAVIQESPRGLRDPRLGAFAELMPSADCLILASKPLDFTLGFGEPPAVNTDAHVVALDADEARAEFVARARGARGVFVRADPEQALATLAGLTGAARQIDADWAGEVAASVAYRPADWQEPQPAIDGAIDPISFCQALAPIVASDAGTILITDGGEIGQWAQAMLQAPRMMTNSVAGSIGASLPFALAARTIDPDAPIIAIMGDGTVGFHLAEFETAVREGLAFVAIVGNDAMWNAEHQIQVRDYGAERAIGCALMPARYDEVCAAFGGFGAHVTTADALASAVRDAIASRKPACINVALAGQAAPTIRRARTG